MNRGFLLLLLLLLLKPIQNKIVVSTHASVKLVCVNHITAPADQHISISMITAPLHQPLITAPPNQSFIKAPPNQPLIKPRNLLLNRISPALCNC
ncbi:hypothetical protein Peur_065184 [Populus x canadensis]